MFPFLFKFGPIQICTCGSFPAPAWSKGLGMQGDNASQERCARCAQVLEG